MESGNGGASSKGVLVPLSPSSDTFQNKVLAPLKSAYLYEESKQFFRYKSAVLIKNTALEKKYDDFRAKRREAGYSEEDLKESYGFLLFDDANKANTLGETGVLTGNSTCTTLGDPSNGVYISMYSDCLDLNRWYHGKSGYIAIIRLTKGRVKKVSENYTQNFTAPTEGFDCHVSEQLPSVSAKTSSFLAFERTQYYMYELLNDGSNKTAQSPSAACPFAIVSFSYTDTKAALEAPQEKSEEKKSVCHYFPWRGQLQIDTHFYDVALRSTTGGSIPAELPPVVKIERATSMLDLRKLLPRAVFETCFSGEVFLDGLYCSLCELVSSEADENSSLSSLLWEIKEKDVALTIPLNDGGFLIFLHSSHFLRYDDTGSSASEVLQGMFVFPGSRTIYTDTKSGQRKPAMSSEILRVLPVLNYAEGEVEKTMIDPSEELCEVFMQHMHNYATLINPGLALSPSRDFSIFPDQYDVPDAHKHLYSSPEWTNRAWQTMRSYLNKPVSFQLPVPKVSEILAAGQEERIEDLDDDVYICLSSPEEAPANHVSMGSEDQGAGQKSSENVETFVDRCVTNAEAEGDLTEPTDVLPDDLQSGDATKDSEKSDLTVLIKTDMGTKNLLTPSTSGDLPTELIVSITSAERTVTDESLSVISTESATKHNDFELSVFSTAKLEKTGMNSLNDETAKTKKDVDCPEVNNLTKTKRRKPRRGHYKGRKHILKACIETPSLHTVTTPLEEDNMKSQKEDQAKESSGHPQLSKPPKIDWRKVRKRKRIFGKLSSKNKKLRSATVGPPVAEEKSSDPGQQSFEGTILKELEACPLRKKTERWDLKPVTSECGRILVPHGSADFADQIKSLKDKIQSTKDEQLPEKMLVDATVNAHDTVEMEQKSSTASETAVDETVATTSKGEGNHLPNIVLSLVNLEPGILRQSDDGNGSLTLNPVSSEHSSTNDGTDTPPLKPVQEKHTDAPSLVKSATKGEFLLSKLKSVLQRGKRKTSIPVPQETTANTGQETEPCLKKGKVDSGSGMLKGLDAITTVQETGLDIKDVSKMLSVDPVFAYALGLTPKGTPDKIQTSEGQDTQQKKDSSVTEEQSISDKPQIIQRPLSIFPRRSRIKTLKKHQGISAEYVKKKWWLHFQTPACFASEKLLNKDCTSDNSVRTTVKEKSNSACTSTDALTLLADLALSAGNDQVPPQPDPALERKPETSLKKCDLTKDVTSAEQESVLHALLRQPAARPVQPVESPSPSHLMEGSELVGLVSKEHAYSLPPSSSLLLGLSGAPFQVSPLSGSTRLLHHHQTMYGDGFKTLHPSVDQEDRSEYNRTPDYLKKYRRQFRLSRTFDNKDGSIQVTKQWKDNYDFNLDSKYTSDSKDRAIIRALHGPWDFSIQDTSEEVRLIVHMWIGLFYSRTTDRFFHVDSNSTNPCSEESDSLESQSSGTVAAPAQSELKTNSPSLNVTDTKDTSISKALDLSKKDNSVLDQEFVILDLSLRNSNAEIVTSDPRVKKRETSVSGQQKEASETLNTPKTSMGQQKYSRKRILLTDVITKVNARSAYEKATPLDNSVLPALKGVGPFSSAQEEIKSVSVQPKKHQIASGIGHVLHECYNEKTLVKDGIVNSEATEMSLVQKQERDSSKSVTDKEVDSNKKGIDLVHTVGHVEIESKHMENLEVKEKPYQEGNVEPSPKMIHTGDDSAKKESGIVCNGSLLGSEKQLSREEHKAVPLVKAENVHEDVDCCTEHEDKVIKADSSGKEDGHDEKDSCISDVEPSSALNDQLLPMMCNGPSSVKKDCISECNGQAPLDEQPSQADNKEDGCHDLQLRTLCANGSGLMDEHVSEKAPCAPSELEPISSETVVEKISENVCLADLSDQPLPMTYDGPDLEKKDCMTECNRQAPLDEQPSQADNKEDDCHDSQLRALCATDRALTDEHVSEKAPCAPSELEPISSETVVEKISENVCLADLSDQPLPMTYDGPDFEKKDCMTECNRQAPLDEQPSQPDNKEDDCHDSQLRALCATDRALTDEHVSEKAPCAPSELEPISNEIVVEKISESVCLADLSDQPLPMTYDGPDLEKKDCMIECNRQAPLDEQPSQPDNKEDDCHDSQLRALCATDRALTDEHVSEKAPCAPSELKPISSETVVEKISENVCLADLSDQPLPMTYDGPDLEKKDCMTECNRQAPLDEQPSQPDNKEDDCHDSQLRALCATDRALTDEHVSEKAPCAPSELEPISNEIVVEKISESVCLADLSDEPLPMTNDGPDLVKKDCMMECNRQTPLDKQPPQADNKEDPCHDLQLRTICVANRAVRDEHFLERNHYVPSEMEPIHDEPAVKEISENVGLADLSDQPLPLTNDGPDFVKKDCITDCSDQAPPLDEQPPQADNKEVSCHDFQLRKLCEPVVEENKENDICLADKAHQKAALPISDESTCLDESSADGPLPQVNDSVETGGQNKLMANFSLSNDNPKDQDTSFQGEQSVDNTIQKELFYHQPQCGAEVALTKETDLKSDTANKGLEKIHNRVVIPFIGEDISEDEVQPCESHSEHKVEKVQTSSGLTEIPFIGETTHPETVLSTDLRSTSQLYSNKVEMSAGKIPFSLFNLSETNQPEVSGSESDDRCPTPTMDEKPYQYVTCSGPSSSSSTTFNGSETWKNINQKCLSKSAKSIPDEMALDQKQKSTVNSDPIPHHGLHPDLELRTLRVLQSIDKFFSKSSHTNKPSQIQTAEMKHSLDQTSNISTKYSPTCFTPSHTSAAFKDKKTSNTKPVVASASTSQQLDTQSPGHFLISPIKSKLEDLLGVRLQLNHTDSSVNHHYFEKSEELQENAVGKDCYPQRSFPSTECLQAIKPNIYQDEHKTTSQTNLGHEPRSYCQRPVMAVKPSKSDEIQAECICKDSEDSVMSKFSKDKQTKTPIVTYTTPASMLLEKKTESLNEDKQEFSAVLDPLYLYEGMDFSKFNKIPSASLPVQPFESAKTSSKLVDVSQNVLTNSLVETVGKTPKENNEMDQKDYLGISTLVADYKDDTIIDDGLILGPQSSLTCTVYNTRQKRSDSFLEQLSKRCLQEDLTQATLEQECLIFSEQMKQLLKKRPIHQQVARDNLNLSCSSPVTVQFSSLEEQGDSMVLFDVDEPSLVGQKIKVDMSDRKQPAETTEESTSHPQKSSQRTGNPMEHAGVSGVTAECASLYTALMNDVCAVAKDPSRPKHLRTIRGGIKTEPSNHFDFCDQMKREMDESFRSNLNSIVKKSCKTKYRFYTLVTSDDTFFEETKAQLEAEGHTAVQPSEFFLSEDTSSSLLIILRNEDIAEHICEVPHLLELKKSPSVQFAGIDEPDDVVNLTHQELFMRGGFIMFDRATLESLSLSNMKKMSEILQELSRTGKWKWMLHYRDSRRIKENARLSAEAKEKKHFLNWCHEVGLLEVLPYHECDLMSKDQPDYLSCLVRLQVQNISARYPVFITDATDSAFGTNGILTMTSSSFLTCSLNETFTV